MDALSKLQEESRQRHAEINAIQIKRKKRKRRRIGAYNRKPINRLEAVPKPAPVRHLDWERIKMYARIR